MAKDPAGRFQTAAEVADLFKQHLAHLDDPPLQLPSSALAGRETAAYLPAAAKKAQFRRKWAAAAAAVVLLPVLALAVTEFAGITHWFRGGGAPIEPNKSGGEPTPPGACGDAAARRCRRSRGESPQEREGGDWAEFKTTQAVNGRNLDLMTRMEVTAKTEKTAIIRTIVTVYGRAMTSGDQEIDLSKNYDPAPTPKRGLVADANIEEGESGKEKLKVGDKEYENFLGDEEAHAGNSTARIWKSITDVLDVQALHSAGWSGWRRPASRKSRRTESK